MSPPLLYYVRHGETDWNVAGRLQGRCDTPLNARGRDQAAHCGRILHDLCARNGRSPAELDYIASPLVRARQTMELMRAALGMAPQGYRLDARLREMAFGDWEGLTLAEVAARDPAAIVARERDKWRFVPPDGESYEQMAARMREWYASLRRDSVIAAHGGTARALIVHLGIAPAATAPRLSIEQGVVYRFEPGTMEMISEAPPPQVRVRA
jgi:broad specificity phosphatase PhoE